MGQADLIQQALLPTANYSSQIPDNYVVRKALDLLHNLGMGVTAPIAMIPPPQHPMSPRPQVQIQAYVPNGENRIYVKEGAPFYQGAAKGDPRAMANIAAVLAHEGHHITDGPDEASAYDRQLAVLRALGQPTKDIERARAFATGQQQ